jgi:hypothetical protein
MKPMHTLQSAPYWTYSSLIDDDAVEHCRSIGTVQSTEGHETIVVEVVQRDELHPTDNGTVIGTGPAEVLVGGVRVTSADARRLAHYLHAAANVADASITRHPTGPRHMHASRRTRA